MNRRQILSALLVTGVGLSLAGCKSYAPPEARAPLLRQEETLDVCVVIPDMSSSFTGVMGEKGWWFMTKLLRNFKRDLAGEDGTKVIVAQISGTPESQAPIFDGSLRSFGRKVGGASDFQSFLRAKSPVGGSRVFDSIRVTVDYAAQFVGPNTRAGVFVLSDMDDNLSGPGAEEKLVESFAAWGKKGGSVGLYWVDLNKVGRWEANLRRAGVTNFVVQSGIAADPTFPQYER